MTTIDALLAKRKSLNAQIQEITDEICFLRHGVKVGQRVEDGSGDVKIVYKVTAHGNVKPSLFAKDGSKIRDWSIL